MNKLEAILDRLPGYYNKHEQSQVYNLLKAFSDEYEIAYSNFISRADNAIGIETTNGDDLDWRWGALLNVIRQNNESDDTYRGRLSSVLNSLQGGTASSIKYAVAVFLGLADNPTKADRCIQIYDGWKYPNADIEMQQYGHLICVFKLDSEDRDIYYPGIEDDIKRQIDIAKAAGVATHVIVELVRYEVLSKYTHQQLSAYTHQQIREWGVS